MDLATNDLVGMIGLALDRMLAAARRLGDRVAERPDLPGANSVAALVVHGVGVTEYWLAGELLGEPVERDRDAEFASTADLAELEARVADLRARLPSLIDRAAVADASAAPRPDGLATAWSWTPGGMVLHVIEELFQHAGHADITADLLLA